MTTMNTDAPRYFVVIKDDYAGTLRNINLKYDCMIQFISNKKYVEDLATGEVLKDTLDLRDTVQRINDEHIKQARENAIAKLYRNFNEQFNHNDP